MTTLLDLAAHTGLPVETVLRVLLREPTNEAARRSVALAVEELGLPEYPRPDDHIEVLPSIPAASDADSLPATRADASSGSAVEHELVAELRAVLAELVQRIERERRERIDDFELSTSLVTEGWRNVDRRLARLEKIVERLDRRQFLQEPGSGAEVHRLDDVRRPGT
jgi:hypothetical protein